MIRPLVLIGSAIALSCSPTIKLPDTAADLPTPAKPAQKPAIVRATKLHSSVPQVSLPPAPIPALRAPQAQISSAYHQTVSNGVKLSMLTYDDRQYQLRVADQPNGIGSRWTTAQEAAASYNGVAAINGGFFTPEGNPLGLLVETGTRRGKLNQSSLGAAIFLSTKSRSRIIRREIYTQSKDSSKAYNLLQTGPMLAENSRTISGLSKTNSRPRSFIAWDGNHHWTIGYASPCTLDQLSRALAGKSLAGFKIRTAVNLDGGRSSDLWVSRQIEGGGKTHRSFLNKPVRNYLILINR